MADIITPLLLAIFLAMMVDAFARVVRRRLPSLPPGGAILAAIIISTAGVILSGVAVSAKASAFLASLVGAEPKINAMISHVAHALRLRGPGTIDHMLRQLDPTQYLGLVANGLEGVASNAIFVLIYLGFLIASRQTFERKADKLFRSPRDRQEAFKVFLRVRDGVERYLWIQTVTGLIVTAGSWLLMAVVGLDNAGFWAFLIFIVSYVPIVGAVAAIGLPALFALAQFNGYVAPAVLLGGLWAINFVVGNILLPRMQGDSLNLDPLIVMLSLAFWGALWGLTGMFLSTPLTVLAMVILAQFEGSRWIAVLLSADGDPRQLGQGLEQWPKAPREDAPGRGAGVAGLVPPAG
jgi:predicted PurR-regulated permease PerM